METLMKSRFACISWDEHSSVLSSEILRSPQSCEEIKNYCDSSLAAIQKIHDKGVVNIRSILDTSEIQCLSFDLVMRDVLRAMPKWAKAGLRCLAIIKPRSLTSLTDLQELVDDLEGLPIIILDSKKEAHAVLAKSNLKAEVV